MKRCYKSQEARDLLAAVLILERGARKQYKLLMKMGATNIRPDTMLVRGEDGKYTQQLDPLAWNATVRGMHVAMIRHQDGEWLLHS